MSIVYNGTTISYTQKLYYGSTQVKRCNFVQNGVSTCVYIFDESGPGITLSGYSTATEGATTSVRVQASDSESGVAWVRYGSNTQYTSDYTFTVNLSEGSNNYTFYACDNAGNTSSQTITIKRYPYRSSTVTITGTEKIWAWGDGKNWWYILYRWCSASASINSNYNVTSYSPTSSDSREILSMGTPEQHFYSNQSISYSNHTFTVNEVRASQDDRTDNPTTSQSYSITITYYYYDHS